MRSYYENRSYSTKLPVYAKVTKGFSFLAHWHTDIEILLVLNGQIRVGINQDERVLTKGDIAVCTSGQIHFYNQADMESEIILVIFHPKQIGFPDGWPKEQVFLSPFIVGEERKKTTLDSLQKVLQSLCEEVSNDDEATPYMISARLYEIAGLLTRYSGPVTAVREAIRSQDLSIAHQILRYMDNRYMTNLTLEKVADEFNVSASYLSKLVKKTSGMNFLSYLVNRRMLRAEYLLKTSDKSITEIAFDCGFESIRTFNRIFREMNDLTPSQYRRKIQ